MASRQQPIEPTQERKPHQVSRLEGTLPPLPEEQPQNSLLASKPDGSEAAGRLHKAGRYTHLTTGLPRAVAAEEVRQDYPSLRWVKHRLKHHPYVRFSAYKKVMDG